VERREYIVFTNVPMIAFLAPDLEIRLHNLRYGGELFKCENDAKTKKNSLFFKQRSALKKA
jgi:hypothetical protein